jgi:hypothetical protein
MVINMKSSALSSIKFSRLKRRLNLQKFQIVGLLESIWLFTLINTPSGDIGRYSNEDIAAYIEWAGDPDELITHLIQCGWLEESDEYRIIVHDWDQHCPNYIKGNLSKLKKSFVKSSSKYLVGIDSDNDQELQFPIIDKPKGPKWTLPSQFIDEWCQAFPDVDVLVECRRALAWLNANPNKHKKAVEMKRFLFGWIGRTSENLTKNRTAETAKAHSAPLDFKTQAALAAKAMADNLRAKAAEQEQHGSRNILE